VAAYCHATVSILAEDITADSCHIRKESGFKFAPIGEPCHALLQLQLAVSFASSRQWPGAVLRSC
jgi:hypothetical protein